MTELKPALLKSPLLARKGQATPAPAVGFVGVDELQGKLDRRERHVRFDGRERRSGRGANPVQEMSNQSPAAAETALGNPAATSPGLAETGMSNLIRRNGPVAPAQTAPPPTARLREVALISPRDTGLTTRRGASLRLAVPAATCEPLLTPKRRGKRHTLTVRADQALYEQVRKYVKQRRSTYQDFLTTAITAYLPEAR